MSIRYKINNINLTDTARKLTKNQEENLQTIRNVKIWKIFNNVKTAHDTQKHSRNNFKCCMFC